MGQNQPARMGQFRLSPPFSLPVAVPEPTKVVLSDLQVLLGGDFDNDVDVDGRDFLVWRRGVSSAQLSADDLADWQGNYRGGTPGGSEYRRAGAERFNIYGGYGYSGLLRPLCSIGFVNLVNDSQIVTIVFWLPA